MRWQMRWEQRQSLLLRRRRLVLVLVLVLRGRMQI